MLLISVRNEKQYQQFAHGNGPFDFGRGAAQGEVPRFVVDDHFASRDHLRVEELPGQRLRLMNLSTKYPITLGDQATLPAGAQVEVGLPMHAKVGQTVVEFRCQAGSVPAVQNVGLSGSKPRQEPTRALPALEPVSKEAIAAEGFLALQPIHRSDARLGRPSLGDTPTAEALTQWMETVLALQRSQASPGEFYAQTARALVGMVELDVGLVLVHDATRGWQVVARAAHDDEDGNLSRTAGREFSQTVLHHVLTEKQTFFQDLGLMKSQESLRSVDAVVVSPIFGTQEEIVGALYGLRRTSNRPDGEGRIKPLEAQLVQLLAAAVGANLARVAATRTRTQFEQFFSAELVRELERDPELLEGRAREVTILMSDLRGFSTLSERLGPQDTCRLVRDVMEHLSERIVEFGGVIVSYMGDGILAMWNAPAQQPDHAAQACRAALAMLREMGAVNQVWEPVVGHPLSIGVGINTGPAQVGNTGSSRKFMYGPLGNTVNLASRVEGATKYLQVPILLTGSTRELLGATEFCTRRLCQVRVVGIQGAVSLYELHGATSDPAWVAYRDVYEAALAQFEARQWLKCCQMLLPLLEHSPTAGAYDHATLKLMRRSWGCLEAPPDPFEPVLELSSK